MGVENWVPWRGGKPPGLDPDVAAIWSKWSCKACTTLDGIRTVEQPLPAHIIIVHTKYQYRCYDVQLTNTVWQ